MWIGIGAVQSADALPRKYAMATKNKTAQAAASAPHVPTFTPRKPQEGLLQLLLSDKTYILAAGSSRVGKSWLYMVWILLLCEWYPGSRHGIFRRNRNACDRNLFKLTLHQAIKSLGMTAVLDGCINKSDLTVTFPNGSVIAFGGLDEHNRDRELGSEYQTIWMNEVSEFDYEDVEFLKGRLYDQVKKDEKQAPPGAPQFLKHRMLFDCNPGTFDDWDYKLFSQRIHPLTNAPLQYPQDYGFHRLITDDQEYIRRNADQSEEWKQRFIYANWTSSNPDAMFQRKYIDQNRYTGDMPTMRYVVVGVDPAGTSHKTSDWTGIIVAGLGYDGHVYVLADRSVKSPDWDKAVIAAYEEFGADEIVAERNSGHDLIKKVLYQQANGAISVDPVWAKRGKDVRAKPIADKYRENMVHHMSYVSDVNGEPVEPRLSELEIQMCSFGGPAHKGKSPDRMDALVWALWKLFRIDRTGGPARVTAVAQQGYWR